MAGRKTKLTPELIKDAERLVKGGNYANVVCEFLGIGETTWYRWMSEGEQAKSGIKREFWESIKKAEAEAEIRLVTSLQQIAERKEDPKPFMWMLERKFSDRWGRKDRVSADISHSGEMVNREETHVSIHHQISQDEESRELVKQLWRRNQAMKWNESDEV